MLAVVLRVSAPPPAFRHAVLRVKLQLMAVRETAVVAMAPPEITAGGRIRWQAGRRTDTMAGRQAHRYDGREAGRRTGKVAS